MTIRLPHARPSSRHLALAGTAVALSGLVTVSGTLAAHAAPAPPAPTIGVGSNPISIAFDAGSHTAYVANDGSVSTIDTATDTETAEFKTGFHGQSGIAVVQGGQRLLVGNVMSRSLSVVDPVQQKVVDKIVIGRGAQEIAVARSGARQRAYVAQVHTKRISIVNPAQSRLVKQIPLKQDAQTATTTPDQSQVWVGSAQTGKIWVLNTKSNTISRTISLAKTGPVQGIAFGPHGRRAWVSGLGGLVVLDVRTGKVLHTLSDQRLFPGAVRRFTLVMGDVAVSPNGRYAMVLNSTFPTTPTRGSVTIVDTKTMKVSRRTKLGFEPTQLAIAGHTTYVTNFADDTVSHFATPR